MAINLEDFTVEELKEVIFSMLEYLEDTDNIHSWRHGVMCNLQLHEENASSKFCKALAKGGRIYGLRNRI